MKCRFIVFIAAIVLPIRSFSFDQTHGRLADVLAQVVLTKGSKSEVNYTALKANPKQLDAYVKEIQKVTQKDFDSMSRDQKLAFLINSYNGLTIKLVVDHFPIKSIKDVGGLFSSPWKKEFFTLLGHKHNLDDIEQKIIRPVFEEPRVHFALVCASKGCPRLQDKPFLAGNLEAQLASATEVFLNDPSRNRFNVEKHRFEVSSILKWYADDFSKQAGSVQRFLSFHMRLPSGTTSQAVNSADIEYKDYDWSINGY